MLAPLCEVAVLTVKFLVAVANWRLCNKLAGDHSSRKIAVGAMRVRENGGDCGKAWGMPWLTSHPETCRGVGTCLQIESFMRMTVTM